MCFHLSVLSLFPVMRKSGEPECFSPTIPFLMKRGDNAGRINWEEVEVTEHSRGSENPTKKNLCLSSQPRHRIFSLLDSHCLVGVLWLPLLLSSFPDFPRLLFLQFHQSPLHLAAWKGQTKTCEWLLGKGAVVNAQTKVKKFLFAGIYKTSRDAE